MKYTSNYELEKGPDTDSGYDVRCIEEIMLNTGETKTINTGIFLKIPYGFECQVRPKSSLSSKGLLVHLGTIDEGYRGQIKITVTNLNGKPYRKN